MTFLDNLKSKIKRFLTKDNSLSQFTLAEWRLASYPCAHPTLLGKLANRGIRTNSSELLERIAENPQTASDTLEELASHRVPDVRMAVTENDNTPTETLKSLSTDDNPDVRFRLAENSKTPLGILHVLAKDDNPYVRARALATLVSLEREAS